MSISEQNNIQKHEYLCRTPGLKKKPLSHTAIKSKTNPFQLEQTIKKSKIQIDHVDTINTQSPLSLKKISKVNIYHPKLTYTTHCAKMSERAKLVIQISSLLVELNRGSTHNHQLMEVIGDRVGHKQQINAYKIQLLESLLGDKKLIFSAEAELQESKKEEQEYGAMIKQLQSLDNQAAEISQQIQEIDKQVSNQRQTLSLKQGAIQLIVKQLERNHRNQQQLLGKSNLLKEQLLTNPSIDRLTYSLFHVYTLYFQKYLALNSKKSKRSLANKPNIQSIICSRNQIGEHLNNIPLTIIIPTTIFMTVRLKDFLSKGQPISLNKLSYFSQKIQDILGFQVFKEILQILRGKLRPRKVFDRTCVAQIIQCKYCGIPQRTEKLNSQWIETMKQINIEIKAIDGSSAQLCKQIIAPDQQ